jgi:hypothetical protein
MMNACAAVAARRTSGMRTLLLLGCAAALLAISSGH